MLRDLNRQDQTLCCPQLRLIHCSLSRQIPAARS